MSRVLRLRRLPAAESVGGGTETNKPRSIGPHRANQTHRFRAQNAAPRAQQHGSGQWSPVRDEEAAVSNPARGGGGLLADELVEGFGELDWGGVEGDPTRRVES